MGVRYAFFISLFVCLQINSPSAGSTLSSTTALYNSSVTSFTRASTSGNCPWNACRNGGTCRYFSNNGYGYFRCTCAEGYNGTYCDYSITTTSTSPAPTVSDPRGRGIVCGTKICYNNATCYRSSYSSYTSCTCARGFMGSTCDTAKCDKVKDPCKNGGRCYSSGRCYCPSSWYSGSRCEIVKECNPHDYNARCSNGGTCYLGKCNCSLPYGGYYCEKHMNCSSDFPCRNGGTCYNRYCYCPYGFRGRFCERAVPTTPPVCDCKFGNCFPDKNGQPSCFCFNGYTGKTCETEMANVTNEGQWCGPVNPCHNNAICIGNKYDYNCKCNPQKYYGPHCERQYVNCFYGRSCQNGGRCQRYMAYAQANKKYQGYCKCNGFKGDYCQKAIDSYPHWMKIFSENRDWSGTYYYNKFSLPFTFKIDTVNTGKGVVIANFKDKVTEIVMKGFSLEDIYITFNMSALKTPSYRIPSHFEMSGQILKSVKANKWIYKGKISRPDDSIFGAFTVSPTTASTQSTKNGALYIGLGIGISALVIIAVVLTVVIIIRKGLLHVPEQFQHTLFSSQDSKLQF